MTTGAVRSVSSVMHDKTLQRTGVSCLAAEREVVAFSMADRATGEFLVIAVLPEYEGEVSAVSW